MGGNATYLTQVGNDLEPGNLTHGAHALITAVKCHEASHRKRKDNRVSFFWWFTVLNTNQRDVWRAPSTAKSTTATPKLQALTAEHACLCPTPAGGVRLFHESIANVLGPICVLMWCKRSNSVLPLRSVGLLKMTHFVLPVSRKNRPFVHP